MHNLSEEDYKQKYLKYKNKYLELKKQQGSGENGESILTESGKYILFYSSTKKPDDKLKTYTSLSDFTYKNDFTANTDTYEVIGHIKLNECKFYINNYAHIQIDATDCPTSENVKNIDSFKEYVNLIISKYSNKNFNDNDLKDQNINKSFKKWDRVIYVESSIIKWFDIKFDPIKI